MQPGPYSVRLQVAPLVCWRCHALVKAVRGYITHRAFVPLARSCRRSARHHLWGRGQAGRFRQGLRSWLFKCLGGGWLPILSPNDGRPVP